MPPSDRQPPAPARRCLRSGLHAMLLAGVLALTVLPVSAQHSDLAEALGADVLMVNFQFVPAVVRAAPGDVVTWRVAQQDPDFAHTATSDDDLSMFPSSGDGAAFDLTTDGVDVVAWQVPRHMEPGDVVAYFCRPHYPFAMRGLILVQDGP